MILMSRIGSLIRFLIIVLILFTALPSSLVQADTTPLLCWGAVNLNGAPAPVGTTIEIYVGADSMPSGSGTVATAGNYGSIMVMNDNSRYGEALTYRVNGIVATKQGPAAGVFGLANQEVNLVAFSGSEFNPDFESDKRVVSIGEPVTFTNLTTGGTQPYSDAIWDFGDGSLPVIGAIDNGDTITHYYTAASIYRITLTMWDAIMTEAYHVELDYITVIGLTPTPDPTPTPTLTPTPTPTPTPVDETPPETEITSGPPSIINYNDVTFVYTGNDDMTHISRLRYDYKLEGKESSWSSTSQTVKSYDNLPDGHYTFMVKARDEEGNSDPKGDEKSFTVDVTPPTTKIDIGPSGVIDFNDVTFRYSGSDKITSYRNLRYSYKLDGPGQYTGWSSYTSTTYRSYYDLSNGDYTFMVKAKDEAGNVELSPPQKTFTIDVTPPITYIYIGVSSTLVALAIIVPGIFWAKRRRVRRRASTNGIDDPTIEGEFGEEGSYDTQGPVTGIGFVEKPDVPSGDTETVTDVICPVCRAGFAADQEISTCVECGVKHHEECWDIIGGCSTFDCKNASSH